MLSVSFGGAGADKFKIERSKNASRFADYRGGFFACFRKSRKSFKGKITLELLDVDDAARVSAAENINVKSGSETYQISVPLADLMHSRADKIAWFRLRYRVADANDQTRAQGIVSLSQIIKDIFEFHTAASQAVFAGMNYQVRVQARHPFTGAAISAVKIKGEVSLALDSEKPTEKLNLATAVQTDAEGFAVLNFKIPPNAKLDDDGELKITGEKYGFARETRTDLQTVSARRAVFLNTDKPLYQPGQSLNARGLLFDINVAEANAIKDFDLEFLIKDEDDTVLYRETKKTSRFGIAALAWQIPENSKLGTYRIEVKADGEQVGAQEFKVSRYDLPQFSVNAETDRPFYLPENKTATVIVSADCLFGKPVTQGTVKIVRESERKWNYREQKWDATEEGASEGAADADGKFKARIDLTELYKDLNERDYSRYEDLYFAAYFTDATTNRTEAKRFDIRISKEAIHREIQELRLQVPRKTHSKRGREPWLEIYKLLMRKYIETTIGEISKLFPKKIHATNLNGFVLKIALFLFAYQIDKAFIQ